MKRLRSKRLVEVLKEIIFRFPLAIFFILMSTFCQLSYQGFFFGDQPIQLTFLLGMLLAGVVQLIFEHYGKGEVRNRWLLYVGVIVLVALYYGFIRWTVSSVDQYWTFYSIPGIRSLILFFIVSIAFIWVPTIKTEVKFSGSFLVVFRSYFVNLFFSLLLFIGIVATILLFQFLFFNLDADWISNSGILIFNFLFPTLFIGSIPKYDGDREELEISKFLKLLITYVFIPIMAILSVIIVLYIVTNLTSDFFGESLIEGLTLSYTISGWIILLLADNLEHVLAKWFRHLFPYALIFVIVLQMISTFIQIREVGVTHGRYLILLFGIGSIVSGVWYLMKKQDLSLLPLVAIVAGMIALIPPIDAMGLSARQQRDRIHDILEEHDMFVGENEVEPNADVPAEDQEEVVESIRYLSSINALNQLGWLPEGSYDQAESYLGFTRDFEYGQGQENNVMLETEDVHLAIEGYTHFYDITLNDILKTYQGDAGADTFEVTLEEDEFIIKLTPVDSDSTISFDFSFIFDEFRGGIPTQRAVEDLTFTVENEGREIQLLIQQLYQYGDTIQIRFYLFI